MEYHLTEEATDLFRRGPANGGFIHRVAAIEFAITAGSGGKGSVWIDDLSISPLSPDSPFDLTAPSASNPLIGTWESQANTSKGVGNTLDFSGDGWVNATYAAAGAFTYTIADNRLTTVFHDLGGETTNLHTATIHIDHDVLSEADDSIAGNTVTMARIRPAKPGDDPILQFRGYTDASGAASFVAFAKDGRGLFRVPVSSCSGTWTDSGTRQLTLTINGQGPKVWNYSIANDVLKNALERSGHRAQVQPAGLQSLMTMTAAHYNRTCAGALFLALLFCVATWRLTEPRWGTTSAINTFYAIAVVGVAVPALVMIGASFGCGLNADGVSRLLKLPGFGRYSRSTFCSSPGW